VTTLRFSSWVQPATGAALGDVDPADADPDAPTAPAAHPALHPEVRLLDTIRGGEISAPGPALEVLGPSAVVGLQPGQVVGRFPVPGAVGTEAVNLAAVELASPDLPWRFSPARAGDRQRLRPWLALVVVAAEVEVVAGVPAARMSVDVGQLPDLAESWAWAHAQLDGDGSDPRRGRARLLCPRKLPPNTRLRAAVVPTFLGGRQAGLGLRVDAEHAADPAWRVEQAGPVTLPVYDHWEFTTGADADFEALARRIKPVKPSDLEGFGYRMVDVSEPWTGDDPLPGDPAIAVLGGALRPLAPPPEEAVTAEQFAEFHRRIAEQLAAGADGDFAPPLRGGHHVLRTTILTDDGDWLDEANREPVRRLASGRGSDWVIAHQEELMAKAWEQAGEIRAAARRLAAGRAAVAITESLQRRHLDTLTGDELISVTAPVAGRARVGADPTQPALRAVLDASAAPAGATSTTLARLKRPAATVGRTVTQPVTRAIAGAVPGRTPPGASRAAVLAAAAAAAAPLPDATIARRLADEGADRHLSSVAGAATSVWIAAQVTSREGVGGPVALMSAIADPSVFASGPTAAAAELVASEVRTAVLSAIGSDQLGSAAFPLGAAGPAAALEFSADGLRIEPPVTQALVRSAIQAASAVRRRLQSVVTVPGRDPAGADALAPVLRTPDVPAPMAMALIDRDPNWFLPGIGEFPVDRATLLSPDDQFAEAVMLGANVELLSEFLWREFPTDRRGTPIRRFWPRPGGEADIGPIHEWTGELGAHMVIDGEATTVILIRAELFRRYPTTVVLAAPAEPDPDHPGRLRPVGALASWLTPLFTVPIDVATRAVAFGVRPDEVTVPPEVAPGWFFVLVEPPTSIRFGFDAGAGEGEVSPPLHHWNDLTWDAVRDGRDMASARPAVTTPDEEPADAPLWGGPAASAADVARIALQRPVRVALHASRMVG
jgi:hypothetical protein